MYNTNYKCIKPLKLWNKEGEVKIPRKSIWKLAWCGGEKSMKELTGLINNKPQTIILPDCYIEKYFKKV